MTDTKTLNILKARMLIAKDDYFNEKTHINKSLRQEKAKTLFWINVLFYGSVLFNLGALALTNYMVVQNELGFEELNPLASKIFDSLGNSANLIYIYWTLKAVLILSLFEWYKHNITREQQIIGLYLFMLTSFFLTGFDYFNDFSYWIGIKNGG